MMFHSYVNVYQRVNIIKHYCKSPMGVIHPSVAYSLPMYGGKGD
jgi:hypothetical protein